MMRVEIISTENIKPSSPTPQHLKTYNLCVLHQLLPAPYTPAIFYYPNQDGATKLEVHERQEQLKRSLSETLTHFYPLAGTIKDDLSIDCDDAGAYFAVARVNTSLTQFLKRLDLNLTNRFLPCDPLFNGSDSRIRLTNVQVNVFECGGFAIGLCVSHRILDGAAFSTFLKCWAALHALNSEEVVSPDLTTPFLPANDTRLKDSSMPMWPLFIKTGKCSTRRFVFDGLAIATLKSEATKNGLQHPTRVEVVTAFLWKCIMAASTEKRGFKNPCLLSHAVNLRKRSGTILRENSIGNLFWLASAECGREIDINLHGLIDQVRGSILEINGEFVRKLQGDEGFEVMEESLKRMKNCAENENIDYIGFSSWSKMGFYDVDFGWGKPVWVCTYVSHGSPVFIEFVALVDTKNGDGIEAWVNIDEPEMRILEDNTELLALTSLDPSPI